ncbi:outer membrane protein assembly factor BamE [Luteimonas arsenica]|uniref:outer membrane protein assembly factor BamE n=1 Tax=Luteimonas arsenica TaxID=1586242 RepID=UPI0010560C97|nr:outer membrane protein assembly factor BamE [Luteimonas arsenica]
MHKLIVTALVACLATGCGIVYRQPVYQGNLVNPANVEQLQVGMNRQQVSALLGTPSIQDPFHHDRWDYTATERVGRVGKTTVHNLVLHFEGDSLARWEGDYFPERNKELIGNVRKQFGPNLARPSNQRQRR